MDFDPQALLIVDPSQIISASEVTLAKQLYEALVQHYPGYDWGVNVDERNGVAYVRAMNLSGKWGYTLKIADLFSATELARQAMLAGGEILERYAQRRGVIVVDNIRALPVDFSGNHIPAL